MTEPSPLVVTIGETMGLARANEIGSFAQITDLRLAIGGAESNVAIALSRLGIASAWIGRVGADSLGERIERELRAEGVESHAIVDSSAPTGFMMKEKRSAQSTQVWYYRASSAGSRLAVDDIDPDLIASAALLHVTGITPGLSPSARDAVFAAVEVAMATGVEVSFDVNHRSAVWQGRDPQGVYRELATRASLVFAGEDEAALIVPDAVDSVPSLALAIADLGPSEVVIKRGALGCSALVDGFWYERAAVPIAVVDSVGAGDAFVGGYLAERLRGAAVSKRLETATAAGAFACLTGGDWEGLPTRKDLGLLIAQDPVSR